MTVPIQCPSCFSMNKPSQTRCRVCGRRLKDERGEAELRPVVLQRVTSGEVFTAVLGDASQAETPETLPVAEAPEPVAVPVDATAEARGALAAIAGRLAKGATAQGQRFKPYTAEHARKPETPEAKKAITRQLESGARAFREKRFDAAIEHLLKAIAKDDGDPRSWALLGESYLHLERPYKAAVGYLRALDLDPRSDAAWLGLSRALKATGDLAGALEVLDRAVRVNPNLVEAWSERGLVQEALNNLSDAVKSFTKVLELRPDHPVARAHYDELAAKAVGEVEPPPPSNTPTASEAAAPPATEEDEEEFPTFEDLIAAPAETPAPPVAEEAPKPPAAASPRPPRVHTFVEGLDETIGGGIPWGHVVLLEGSPGTMKSSLAFSVLLQNAAREGMHCLYLSLEERTSSLLKQMGSLGLHLRVEKGSLVVLDPRAAKGLLEERPDWIAAFQAGLATIKAQRGLDLIVIDSLEALEVLAKFTDRRREIFRLFEWLRDLDVTSFVVTERPDWVIGGHVVQGRWDEDFLADAVLHLRQHLVSDLEVQRRLRVVKMRGTRHDTGYLAFVLDEGRFKVTRAMSP